MAWKSAAGDVVVASTRAQERKSERGEREFSAANLANTQSDSEHNQRDSGNPFDKAALFRFLQRGVAFLNVVVVCGQEGIAGGILRRHYECQGDNDDLFQSKPECLHRRRYRRLSSTATQGRSIFSAHNCAIL